MNVLVLAVFTPALVLQTPDTTHPHTSPDRYTIDVAALVREGTARTLSEVLISRVPGLLVIPGSGLKGSGASIRFAGVRSLVADVPPLILVDGFRIDAREDDSQLDLEGPGPSRLDDIRIEDVQSIEIVRGPASGSVYGPGSAAGVILIRTKEGRTGPPRVEGVVQGGVRSVPTRWPTNYTGVDLDNSTPSYRTGCTLSLQATGQCVQDFVQTFNPLADRNPFASAPQRQLGLSATAGPSWGSFRISGMLDGDAAAYAVPAVTWGDDARQWNLRASGTVHPVRNVDVAATVARISSRLQLPMYGPVRDALVGPGDSTGFSWTPFFEDHGTQDVDRTQVGVQVRARPFAWLGLQALMGRDDDKQHELRIIPGQTRTLGQRSGANHTLAFNATAANIAWRGLRFTTTVGVERLTNRDDNRLQQIYPDTATSCGTGSPFPCSFMTQRIVRRVNSTGVYGVEQVGIRGRVFVTGTLRHDGYDDFNAWSATHPSLAVDWIARPDRPGALGRLALRVAYASAAQPLPDVPETFVISPFPTPVAQLKPERTREFELSGEASGLAGKWRAQFSLYDGRSDALQFVTFSGPGGYSAGYVPGAVFSNRGLAAAVSATVVDRAIWGWNLQLSVWGNRNRLVKQPGPPSFYGEPTLPTGQGEFAGYPANGYWNRGVMTFSDLNGDGIIAPTEVAMATGFTWAGTPYPTQGAALSSSWRFTRRWHLSATLDYRAGQTLFNQTANVRCLYARCRGRIDRTAPLGEQAMAVISYELPPGYYEDADYMKLRELALAFDVPERVAAALGARAATIMIGGRDLITWTRYSGADPEAGSYGRHYTGTPTIVGDFATVPVPASWTLRVRVSY
jgi:hypothetical protein